MIRWGDMTTTGASLSRCDHHRASGRPSPVETVPHRPLRIGGRENGVVPPNIHDPRLHLAMVTVTLFVLGIGWLGFQLSIPQILLTMLTCAAIEVAVGSPADVGARVAGERDADGDERRAVVAGHRHRER